MQSKFYNFNMFSEDEILTKIHEMFVEEPFILLELNKILPKSNRVVNFNFQLKKKFFSSYLLLFYFTSLIDKSPLLIENTELNY